MACEKKCETECDKSCKLRLHYFNVRGRAEAIRYALTLAKADWEDVRYNFEDWPQHKKEFPLGQLPVLEWTDKDGKKHHLTQAATILRAVSCWFGLGGKSPCECARADEAFEIVREVADLGGQIHTEQCAERKEQLINKGKNELIPRNFGFLEKKLHERGGKHLAGGECFTYADLVLASVAAGLRKREVFSKEHAEQHWPGLKALVHSVEDQPEIKAYIAKRPDTEF